MLQRLNMILVSVFFGLGAYVSYLDADNQAALIFGVVAVCGFLMAFFKSSDMAKKSTAIDGLCFVIGTALLIGITQNL